MTLSSLTRPETAERLRGVGVALQCGPLVMRFGSSLPELVDPLAMLYSDYPLAQEETLHDFQVRVDCSPPGLGRAIGRARAFIDGRRAFDPFKRRHALPMFEWGVNWCVFVRPSRHLLLHSAVVERSGFGMLLSGRPGAGKSTLTAGLLFRGWRLLSDEVAVVPAGTRDLLPLPRPVGLKGASIDIVRGLSPDAAVGPAVEGTRKGTVAHLRPPTDSVRRMHETATPRWIVFPNFQAGVTAELRQVSRAEALQRLGHEAFNYSVLGSVGFETLASVVENCHCLSLRFGSLDDAIAAVEEITNEPGTGRPNKAGRVSPQTAAGEAGRWAGRVEHGKDSAPTPQAARQSTAPAASILLEALRDPPAAVSLSPSEWMRLMAMARHARLASRLTLLLDEARVFEKLPEKVQEQLEATRPVAAQHERIIRWEVGRIHEALRGIDTTLVLLKGAAYVLAGLPAGHGRLVSDIDILLPRGDLRRVEAALLAAGWQAVELHPYDERHYRDWSHELPPLEHRRRHSVLDVHHNILPVSGRLHPDAEALLGAVVPVGNGLWTLGPEDMVLHAAVHLFQDGDLAGSVRDLVDVDSLLRHFGRVEPQFWNRLVPRAQQLGLGRPLYYALRYARRMLGTPVPSGVSAGTDASAPAAPVRALMDVLVSRSLLPVLGDRGTFGEETARGVLYARSHWLRMPPGRLVTHLARKTARRWTAADDEG